MTIPVSTMPVPTANQASTMPVHTGNQATTMPVHTGNQAFTMPEHTGNQVTAAYDADELAKAIRGKQWYV
jgi:hypothetical protein